MNQNNTTNNETQISTADKIRNVMYGMRKQRFKYGTVATVFTVVVIVAVIFLNVVVGLLTDFYGIKFDMTSEKRMEISDETIGILDKLDREISINVIMAEDDFREETYGNEMAEIMNKYVVNGNGNVTVNYVDPLRNPSFTKTYAADIDISVGDIIVQDETDHDNYTFIQNDDIYYWYDETHEDISGVYIERKLTNAIVTLTTTEEEMPMAVVLYGHGEYNTSYYGELLTESNYRVVYVNTMMSDIPTDASLVLLSAPSTDYAEEEVDKIEKYLKSYHNLVFIHSSAINKLTNLELLFREYGVSFESAVVCDALYRTNNNYANVVTNVPSSVTNDMVTNLNSNQHVVMPYARVMRQLWETGANENITTTVLLTSATTSYGKVVEPGVSLDSYEYADGDLNGGFPMAILYNQTGTQNNKTVNTNILFLSSAYVFDEGLVNTESYGNMQLLTNVLSRFNTSSTTVSVTAKRYDDPELNVAGNSRNFVLVLLLIIPLAVLAMGVVVWQRRKNR